MDYINSLENNTIKKIKKLKIKKYREEEQLFIAEGRKFLDFDFAPEMLIFHEDYTITDEIQKKDRDFNVEKSKFLIKFSLNLHLKKTHKV